MYKIVRWKSAFTTKGKMKKNEKMLNDLEKKGYMLITTIGDFLILHKL